MIEFKRTVFKINLYGDDSVEVKKPNVGELEEFSIELDRLIVESDQAGEFEYTLDFLEMLGLPKEKSRIMEPEHLQEIVSYVTGKKKPS